MSLLFNVSIQTPLPEQEMVTDGIDIDIELLSTKEIAYYMTQFDWDLFWAVHEYELMYHTFGRHHFNKVCFDREYNPVSGCTINGLLSLTDYIKSRCFYSSFQ